MSSKSSLTNEKALEYLLDQAEIFLPGTEVINIVDAYNRVLAQDVISDTNIPGADTSSRDGYCLNSSSLVGASEDSPIKLRLVKPEAHAGHLIPALKDGECAYIATGGVLPQDADSVVMLENSQLEDDRVLFKKSVAVGEYVRTKASEMKIGEIVAKKFDVIEPSLAGKIVAAGSYMIKVFKKPVVAIITSGDEIVMPWEKPEPWQVRTQNPTVLNMLIQQNGGICKDFGVAKDTDNSMEDLFTKALESADIIVTSGGIAMGHHDPVRNLFEKLGIQSDFQKYGSHFRPVFYTVYKGKPIFALPGTPEGMQRIFALFVAPFLKQLSSSSKN